MCADPPGTACYSKNLCCLVPCHPAPSGRAIARKWLESSSGICERMRPRFAHRHVDFAGSRRRGGRHIHCAPVSSPSARWTGGGNGTCELLHTLKKFFCRRLGEFGTQTAEFLAALPKAAAVRPKRHR